MLQTEIAGVIRALSTGIYGIGVHHGGERRIFTASWVMPVSFDPVLIALSINPEHRSYRLLTESRAFSINVISKNEAHLAAKLAAPGDRLQGLTWRDGVDGCPLLEDAMAHLECRTFSETAAGDHQLIMGELIGGALRKSGATPLLYVETGNLDGAATLFPEQLRDSVRSAKP